MNDENSPISISDLAKLRKEVRKLLKALQSDPFPKELPDLLRALQSSRFQAEDPHDQRKYSYSRSNNELGYRLVMGQDPARVPEDELEKIDPLSPRTIRALLSDGDCPLYRIKVGGSAFVTEVTVQQYEQYIAEGAPSYMAPNPRS